MEGRSQSAVTHLATARRQTVRNGILGLQKIKAARDRCFIFYKKKSEKAVYREKTVDRKEKISRKITTAFHSKEIRLFMVNIQ